MGVLLVGPWLIASADNEPCRSIRIGYKSQTWATQKVVREIGIKIKLKTKTVICAVCLEGRERYKLGPDTTLSALQMTNQPMGPVQPTFADYLQPFVIPHHGIQYSEHQRVWTVSQMNILYLTVHNWKIGEWSPFMKTLIRHFMELKKDKRVARLHLGQDPNLTRNFL